MNKIIKIVIAVVVLAIIAYFFMQNSGQQPAQEINNSAEKVTLDRPIKVGVVAPLSGEAAIYGENVRNAVELAVEEINANGQKVEVIYEDGKCNGKDASNAGQKLINVDNVDVILGGACSGETLAIAPIAESTQTPIISSVSSSPDVTDAGNYVFRTYFSDAIAAKTITDSLSKEGLEKYAIFTENTEYAQGLRRGIVEGMSEADLVLDEAFNSDATDFRTSLTKLASDNADAPVLIVAQTSGNLVRIISQARELGMDSQFYAFYFSGPEVVQAGPAVEGLYIYDTPSVDLIPGTNSFISSYNDKFGKNPEYGVFAAISYDTMNLIYQTVTSVGFDSEGIINYWYDLDNYAGITLDISFDENGDVENPLELIKFQIQDQKLVKVD